jgi:predicted DNA-binding transcriptional regulator YafY
MPKNKSASLRYRIIDACLTNTRRKYPTIEDIIEKISEQLGTSISESMLNKDFAEMRSTLGAPIAYSKTHKGYYYSEPNYSLKEFPLTNEEIEALDFSTALLHHVKGTRLFDQFENAINKLIEGYRISKVIGKPEKQFLQVEEPTKYLEQPWLETLLKSVIEKYAVQVEYQAFGKQPKVHMFSAYLLKEYRNRWYVVGHSDRADDIIILALDRIMSINDSRGKYIQTDNFIPEDYFKYSFGITQISGAEPEKVELVFMKSQAPYIKSQPLHHSQHLIHEDDKTVSFGYEVYITQELIMTILSYGSTVVVKKPAKLKSQIKQEVQKMAKLYASR